MTQDITSLIEKLEGASEGSGELDAEIAVATRWPAMGNIKHWIHEEEMEPRLHGYIGFKNLKDNPHEFKTPEVTTSLDAALALAERVLLGDLTWRIEKDSTFTAAFWSDPEYEPIGSARSATPALALCAAILRAQSEAR